MDTIFALATSPGRSGVAVVRISGPDALGAGRALCGSIPEPSHFSVRKIRGADGLILDRGLVLYFAAPASFTGEDVVELHLHGSIAIIQSVLSALEAIRGMRIADPGEFTRRALENGKMDLAQVEGLSDLIDAETELQRKQAFSVLEGALSSAVERWRVDLIRAASLLEVTIDFADEDVPVDVSAEVSELMERVRTDLSRELEGVQISERIRTGFEVAIVGPPNAGKSSLLNSLAGRDAAITSEIAGTTRDVIEVRMDLGGIPVTFLDTAGLRESVDKIESIGIARAIERAQAADLRIFLTDDQSEISMQPKPEDIVVSPKVDVKPTPNGVSGKTGQGVSELMENVRRALALRISKSSLASRARHGHALRAAIDSLDRARDMALQGPDVYDLAAEDLRSAIRSLEMLVGRIDVENLLDEIFSNFCLGK